MVVVCTAKGAISFTSTILMILLKSSANKTSFLDCLGRRSKLNQSFCVCFTKSDNILYKFKPKLQTVLNQNYHTFYLNHERLFYKDKHKDNSRFNLHYLK